jgi:hypothetical protein
LDKTEGIFDDDRLGSKTDYSAAEKILELFAPHELSCDKAMAAANLIEEIADAPLAINKHRF